MELEPASDEEVQDLRRKYGMVAASTLFAFMVTDPLGDGKSTPAPKRYLRHARYICRSFGAEKYISLNRKFVIHTVKRSLSGEDIGNVPFSSLSIKIADIICSSVDRINFEFT